MNKKQFGKIVVEYNGGTKFIIVISIVENGIQIDKLDSVGNVLKSENAYNIARSKAELEKIAADWLEDLF